MFKCKRENKKQFKLPSALTILFVLISFVILISWIPGTTGDWYLDINDLSTIQHGRPAGIFDLFLAPLKGFGNKLDIIIFVLVLGGFLNIVIESHALDAGIRRLVLKIKGKEIWIIPILMTIFAVSGATYGMGEETIAFYPILIPVMLAVGFDAITSLMIILIGAGIGCIGSILNPFVIAVSFTSADSIRYEINSSSGILFRLFAFLILVVVAILFVMWYAIKIKKQPMKSPLFTEREVYHKEFAIVKDLPEFTKKRKIILIIFTLTFLIMIFSLISWSSFGSTIPKQVNDWVQNHAPYLASFFDSFGDFSLLAVASIFLLSSIIISCIGWNNEEQYIKNFVNGSSDILSVCLVIATAAGIGWVMQQTGMQYKLIKTLELSMKSLHTIAFIIVGYLFFLVISIFIPLTSGFATAIMPILGPTSELVHPGLWSGTITSFSFANGLINLLSPTSFILMAALTISKIPINKYLRVASPFLVIIFMLSIILLTLGTLLPITNGGIWF